MHDPSTEINKQQFSNLQQRKIMIIEAECMCATATQVGRKNEAKYATNLPDKHDGDERANSSNTPGDRHYPVKTQDGENQYLVRGR